MRQERKLVLLVKKSQIRSGQVGNKVAEVENVNEIKLVGKVKQVDMASVANKDKVIKKSWCILYASEYCIPAGREPINDT